MQKTISKVIASDVDGLTKTATLAFISMQGSIVQIGIAVSYAGADGMVLQPVEQSKQAIVIQLNGADVPANANLSATDKAKLAADQVIYNQIIDALSPVINNLIDTNTEAV